MSSIKEIVFRGDQACYEMRKGTFPYIDRASAAGATGVHLWFWEESFRAVAQDFIDSCKAHGMGVHLGIGIGAYGVCDHQDPLDPAVMRKIKSYIGAVVDQFDIAGIEFQTGEYDRVEYEGKTVASKSHAQQVCEHLNPYVDFAKALRPDLWIRTELNAEFFTNEQLAETANLIDPRCTVEWSRFTGPYQGPRCYTRGRSLLQLSAKFSLFLKIVFRRDPHWKEIAADVSVPQVRLWIEHWRGWVRMLDEMRRSTLTICNVDQGYLDTSTAFPVAAVALARDPVMPADEVLALMDLRSPSRRGTRYQDLAIEQARGDVSRRPNEERRSFSVPPTRESPAKPGSTYS